MNDWVDALAYRIAGWPPEAVALCKASINNAEKNLGEALRDEAYLFQQSLRNPSAQAGMRQALALGAQTRDGELRIGELCSEVAAKAE